MKHCTKCKTEKPFEAFNKRNKGQMKYQSWCKECISSHNKDLYNKSDTRRNQILEHTKKYKAEVEQFLYEYLKAHPCAGCGETNILTLQFDHLKDKNTNISQMLKHRLPSVQEEVSKCQVLCANCHSIKTAQDSKNWKLNWLNKPEDMV